MAMAHTDNPVFGCALNPFNPSRSVGGSSGGEAGLVSSRCSPIGLASDLAGSIRIPASFVGKVGFKPTPQRTSQKYIAFPAKNDMIP